MVSLCTQEGKKKYKEHLEARTSLGACPLCEKKSIKDFLLWKLTENSFPYDQIAKTHHMLIPIRHVSEEELSGEELEELKSIKKDFIHIAYDWILEAAPKNQTIPDHFHLHLIVGKS